MFLLGSYFAIGLVVSIVMLVLLRLDEGGFNWRHRDTYLMLVSVVAVTLFFGPLCCCGFAG